MAREFDTITHIGVFSKDGVPRPFEHQFCDENDDPIVITGFTVGVSIEALGQVVSGLGAGGLAINDGANGKMTYTFVAADFSTAGRYRIQFWAQNSGNTVRHVSQLWEYDVNDNTDNPI